jgi:hypothetical protein
MNCTIEGQQSRFYMALQGEQTLQGDIRRAELWFDASKRVVWYGEPRGFEQVDRAVSLM